MNDGVLYRVLKKTDGYAVPGCLLFNSNDDNVVRGFGVSDDGVLFTGCMFNVNESNLPQDAEILKTKLSLNECAEMLRQCLINNPEMQERWADLVDNT